MLFKINCFTLYHHIFNNMEELKSIDYARLIQFAALKNHGVLLNRTQINKILFYVYGRYLAEECVPLFTDDTPKAWPYGPVFPIVNKQIDPSENIRGFSDKKVALYRNNRKAMDIVLDAVNKMCKISAYKLTQWSHQNGSPWYDTLFGENKTAKWNTQISDETIKTYFSNSANII